MRGQDGRYEDERIKIQKKAHRIPELIVPLGFCLDEQKEEKEQEQPLCYSAKILDRH